MYVMISSYPYSICKYVKPPALKPNAKIETGMKEVGEYRFHAEYFPPTAAQP